MGLLPIQVGSLQYLVLLHVKRSLQILFLPILHLKGMELFEFVKGKPFHLWVVELFQQVEQVQLTSGVWEMEQQLMEQPHQAPIIQRVLTRLI